MTEQCLYLVGEYDQYLFGRAKTRSLGQVTTPKKTLTEKKWVLLDPVLMAG